MINQQQFQQFWRSLALVSLISSSTLVGCGGGDNNQEQALRTIGLIHTNMMCNSMKLA
jgi:hypothetical protein